MRRERVIETCVYAQDLEAARAFYARLFGREPFTVVDGRHVFFRYGDGVFLVFNPEVTRLPTGPIPVHGAEGEGHAAFFMEEDEIDATRERLRTLGIAIETEYEWPGGGYSIYFRDPAGNSLEFTTPKTWGLDG